VIRQYPSWLPLQFSDYRDGAPGLSVLELLVQGDTYKQVTPESPLVVHVAKPIAADEVVLPLAFDPETGSSCAGQVRTPRGKYHNPNRAPAQANE